MRRNPAGKHRVDACSHIFRYALAAAAVAAVLAIRLALHRAIEHESPALLFYLAIAAAARFGGPGPGLLATALGMVALWLLLPISPSAPASSQAFRAIQTLLLGFAGVQVSWLTDSLRRQRQRAAEGEHILGAVIAQMPAGVVIIEAATGKLVAANDHAWRIWRCEAPIGADTRVFTTLKGFHADGRPYAPDEWPLMRALRSGESVIGEEIEIERGDGTRGFTRSSAAPVHDAEGRVVAAVVVFTDITGSRRMEASLRESEERLRLALDAANMASWHWDLRSGEVTCSERGPQLLGLDAEHPVTLAVFRAALHPEDRDTLDRRMSEILTGDTGRWMDYRVVWPDGSVHWLSLHGRTYFEQGDAAYIEGIAFDITERKQAEDALRRYELLSLHSRDILLFMRRDGGRLLEANAAAVEAYGYTREELLSLTIHDLRAPGTEGLTAEQMAEADANGILFTTLHRRRDGSIFPVEVSSRGATIGGERTLLSIVRDITRRKRDEREREATIELLRLVNVSVTASELVTAALAFFQEQSGCEAVGIRLREGDDYPYYATRGFPEEFIQAESRLCGRDAVGNAVRGSDGFPAVEGLCGSVIRGCYDPVKPFSTPRGSFWTNSTTEFLAATTEADRPARTRNTCNAAGYESVALVPLRVGGEHLGLLQLNDRRKGMFTAESVALCERLADQLAIALARLRAEDAVREAGRRKDEFLAMLGHELRNPLAAVAGAVHLIGARGLAHPAQQRARETAIRQTAHMARLLDDLLDVSRITRGTITLKEEDVDLAAAVESAVESAMPLIEGKAQELDVTLAPETLRVRGDAVRLAQVIANLLTNAARYTPAGGHIRLSLDHRDDVAEIRVRDDGMGIAPDLLPRVFDLFVQGAGATDAAQSGLGIGLTLVRHLVEMHGGSVAAASDGPGCGSEFTITLPVQDTGSRLEDAGEYLQPASRIWHPPRRILVVDDNAAAAEVLCDILEMDGHQVVAAHCGPDAVALAAEYRPEVVILDIGMPGMDGFEVACALRQDRRLAGAQLVALTGYGREEDRTRAREAGFDHYLVKPVDIPALQALLAGGLAD